MRIRGIMRDLQLCTFLTTCFGALDFRGNAYERLITGIRGRRQVEATGIVRKHRIIARRRECLNYLALKGCTANVFRPFTGWRYLSKSTRLVATVCVPAIPPFLLFVDRRSKKNQCALTRWQNVPIRAMFTANVNIYRVKWNKNSIKFILMSRYEIYYPGINNELR